MVVEHVTLAKRSRLKSGRPLPFIPDGPIKTKAAARAASRIAEGLAVGSLPNDGPGEEALFHAMQTCAYRAANPAKKGPTAPGESETWTERWKVIRDHLVERNMGLAFAMTKRFRCREADWEDLRSEAMFALVRAVEGFNPWWGFRFSTYACNAVTRALIHVARRAVKHRARYPVEHDVWLEDPEKTNRWSDLYEDRLNLALERNLAELTDRESLVLGWRFPRDGHRRRTLSEVGEAMGLSKERVRQIQQRALTKLRDVLEADPVLQ